MTVERPHFQALSDIYETYKTDSSPCKDGKILNQCAVRLSLAMSRVGFSFDIFEPQRRVHQGRQTCQLDEAHIVGADELHKYFLYVWDTGVKGKGSDILTQIRAKPGIVYFDNCFIREGETTKKGDHIDLWTGDRIYNQILYLKAGGDTTADSDLFTRAGFVRFFWLR
jgi:hypothetical protein